MVFKKLVWWSYLPSDERERGIYSQAYQRSFAALVFFIATLSDLLMVVSWKVLFIYYPWLDWLFYPRVQGMLLFLAIVLSYVFGSIKLWNQDLEFKIPKKSGATMMVIPLAILALVPLLYSLWTPGYWLGEWPF